MKPDVLIVGAGIIGSAIARELAQAGRSVTVLDADRPGAGASSAAAGILTPHPDAAGDDPDSPFLSICRQSQELFDGLEQVLRDETGIDIELHDEGMLEVALREEEVAELRSMMAFRQAAGFDAVWLDAREVRRREPRLPPEAQGGVYLPRDRPLGNRRLVAAMVRSAMQDGARFLSGHPVTSLLLEKGRCGGVRCGSQVLEAGTVVVAAGCGSPALSPPGREIPVEPVRGQIVCLATEAEPLRHTVLSRSGYLVPRWDGRVLAGTTMERAGHDPRPTAAGVAKITAAALELAPAFQAASFRAAWAGLRPWSEDHWPIVGADPEISGLVHATGHGGNGILLAPLTATWVARILDSGAAPAEALPFRPERFGSPRRRTSPAPR